MLALSLLKKFVPEELYIHHQLLQATTDSINAVLGIEGNYIPYIK